MCFESVYGQLPTPLMLVSAEQLQVRYLNTVMSTFLGTSQVEVSGRAFSDVFSSQAGRKFTREELDLLCENKTSVSACNLLTLSDVTVELMASNSVLNDTAYYLVSAREDTSRVRETQLSFALNESCDGLWDWNAKTDEVYFSPELDRMLGFEPGERKPQFSGWYDLVHEDDATRVLAALKKHLSGESDFYDVEYRIYTKQGQIKQVRDRGRVCERAHDGSPVRAVGMLADITAYREMEAELKLTRDRFEDFARSGSDWFWETGADLKVSNISSQFSLQTGVGASQVKGKNLIDLLQGKGLSDAARATADHLPIRNIRVPVGEKEYWVALSGRPVRDEQGIFVGYRGVGVNIHDQVMLERMVKAYRQNAEIMMDRAPVAISLMEDTGKFFYANESFLKLLRTDLEHLPKKYKQERQLSRPDKELFQSDKSQCYEMVMETLDGPKFYSVLKYRLYRAGSTTRVMVTMVMDITYTRQQEVEQKKIEMVLNNIGEGIVITDANHCIVSANRSIQDATGYSAEELVGNTPTIFSSGRHDHSFYQELWNEVHQLGKWQGEIWNRCRNGSVIRQHVSIQAIVIDGQTQHYLGIYSSGVQANSQRDAEMFAKQNDPLTGLPNRHLFQDRLHMACQRARVRHYSVEITLIRITNLVALNTSHGHVMGDQVLKRSAFQLQDRLPLDVTLSRCGLDEFAVLREGNQQEDIADIVKQALSTPVVMATGDRVLPKFVMETARYPEQGSNANRLVRHLKKRVSGVATEEAS
ncbi:PAS domain S-box protein [Parendozoicomonas sp. Alg238-R29]|uniref:PAS domain S-box protein n=1 Tax=Parendozoicomonas sp. Alg238-R29 TaxID=2993446 RepID=UPI00248DABDE|nr:PAS domain S-box protein [Parendozoicomonas sp. Alg238-R29]